MRKKQVWRYYCDFCNKGRCQANAIANHEIHCTKNPNRQCGMCALNEQKTPPMEWLRDALDHGGLGNLAGAANSCPACMLAAIRQSGSTADEYEWSYTEACERFWQDLNIKRENESRQEILAEMYS